MAACATPTAPAYRTQALTSAVWTRRDATRRRYRRETGVGALHDRSRGAELRAMTSWTSFAATAKALRVGEC